MKSEADTGYNSITAYTADMLFTMIGTIVAALMTTIFTLGSIAAIIYFDLLPEINIVQIYSFALLAWAIYAAQEMVSGRVTVVDEYPSKNVKRVNKLANIVYHNMIIGISVAAAVLVNFITGDLGFSLVVAMAFAPIYHELTYHHDVPNPIGIALGWGATELHHQLENRDDGDEGDLGLGYFPQIFGWADRLGKTGRKGRIG